ncbi:MAG: coenzyme F420-0:L-glutamate ligase [Solirubrobacterales bacterium]
MTVSAFALPGIPEITAGTELAGIIAEAAERSGGLIDGDIVSVAQKVVSKAEGRQIRLSEVSPSGRAVELAARTSKDPRIVQAILDESQDVIRAAEGVLIVRTHHGFVCANAGIDQSNLPEAETALALPLDADASARALRAKLTQRTGAAVAVIVTDSFGRAWRIGQQDVAIGCAGLDPIHDLRGRSDRDSRALTATIVAIADQLAAAADLTRGKSSGEPVVVVRGRGDLVTTADGPGATALLRDRSADLFT